MLSIDANSAIGKNNVGEGLVIPLVAAVATQAQLSNLQMAAQGEIDAEGYSGCLVTHLLCSCRASGIQCNTEQRVFNGQNIALVGFTDVHQMLPSLDKVVAEVNQSRTPSTQDRGAP